MFDIYLKTGHSFRVKNWDFTPYLGLGFSLSDPLKLLDRKYADTVESSGGTYLVMNYTIQKRRTGHAPSLFGGIDIACKVPNSNFGFYTRLGYRLGLKNMATLFLKGDDFVSGYEYLHYSFLYFAAQGFEADIGFRFFLEGKTNKNAAGKTF